MHRLTLSLLLLAASTPAVAVKLTAEATAMRVPAAGPAQQPVALTVIDNRPYVLDGDKTEDFEGLSREVYGIPVSRGTNDGSTMASYLGERLRIGFANAGYNASYRATVKGSRADAVAGQTDAPGVTFVVDLREWKYDYGGFRPSFNYDITVRIYDEKDRLLSSEDFSGTDRMPTTRGWKSFKYRYAELYQTIFDRVFENPAIRTGLRGEASASAGRDDSIEARLTQLRKLLADGLIDQATFEHEQQRVLSEI